MTLLTENQVCDNVLVEFVSEDFTDRIQMPRLEFGNRESIHTYSTTKYTKAERLRRVRDPNMTPVDYVYSMEWLGLTQVEKDEFKDFFVKYAGCPVWMKDASCVWRFGYILNSSVAITTVRDKDCSISGLGVDA